MTVQRWCTLIEQALQVLQAETVLEWRSAQRKLAQLIVEYAYLGSQERPEVDQRPWYQRWKWWNKSTSRAERQATYLELYWFYTILLLRETGELPAWEGIRLVREE